MSLIGNRKSAGGFTLIEVMVATAILALGAVMIHEAFFLSLDTYNYCMNHFNLFSWADHKLWQAQDDLSRLGALEQTATRGTFKSRSEEFTWNLSYDLIDQALDLSNLYRVDLVISWQEGARAVELSRTAYALYKITE